MCGQFDVVRLAPAGDCAPLSAPRPMSNPKILFNQLPEFPLGTELLAGGQGNCCPRPQGPKGLRVQGVFNKEQDRVPAPCKATEHQAGQAGYAHQRRSNVLTATLARPCTCRIYRGSRFKGYHGQTPTQECLPGSPQDSTSASTFDLRITDTPASPPTCSRIQRCPIVQCSRDGSRLDPLGRGKKACADVIPSETGLPKRSGRKWSIAPVIASSRLEMPTSPMPEPSSTCQRLLLLSFQTCRCGACFAPFPDTAKCSIMHRTCGRAMRRR